VSWSVNIEAEANTMCGDDRVRTVCLQSSVHKWHFEDAVAMKLENMNLDNDAPLGWQGTSTPMYLDIN
jgi:hypothetical protein